MIRWCPRARHDFVASPFGLNQPVCLKPGNHAKKGPGDVPGKKSCSWVK
jgi:hypothetical protein